MAEINCPICSSGLIYIPEKNYYICPKCGEVVFEINTQIYK